MVLFLRINKRGFLEKISNMVSGIEFAVEALNSIMPELQPLLTKHYAEVSHFKDIQLNIDWDRYLQLERMGHFVAFTARKDHALIGYNGFYLNRSIHNTKHIAVQDVIFIDKPHRGFGKKFIAWCDLELKERGVEMVYQHLKAHNNYGSMLEAQGYELVDLVFAKRMDHHG